jgi:hypothetical protein
MGEIHNKLADRSPGGGSAVGSLGWIKYDPMLAMRNLFSYPAHRFGVAVAFRRRTGPIAAVTFYGRTVRQHMSLIAVTLALLLLTGALMWSFERRRRAAAESTESSVSSLFDGIYWAVVTMTPLAIATRRRRRGSDVRSLCSGC